MRLPPVSASKSDSQMRDFYLDLAYDRELAAEVAKSEGRAEFAAEFKRGAELARLAAKDFGS